MLNCAYASKEELSLHSLALNRIFPVLASRGEGSPTLIAISLANGNYIIGLSLAWKQGFEKFLVHSDSKQAVDLVNSPSAVSSVLSLVRAIHRLRQKR
ncbi:hypothetical protein V6N11_074267 [Hibiscus sabdariffa]|uniref:RNase H type-1 domain-containing protein n=2 Tax=Hibiscus sabdariffa TaxID=183260 RepID=A0ABR1ZH52_9ROSI